VRVCVVRRQANAFTRMCHGVVEIIRLQILQRQIPLR
jgi:hypothetical protein